MKYSVLSLLFLLLFSQIASSQTDLFKFDQVAFIENKGQVYDQHNLPRHDVLFSGRSQSLIFHLMANGISYQQTSFVSEESAPEIVYRIDIEWLGINHDFQIGYGEPVLGESNYYLPACSKGIQGVRSFSSITYLNIYDGIDLVWRENEGNLEYDFILSPGSDYHQILWEIKGADELYISESGDLVLKTPLGEIHQEAPNTFQEGVLIPSRWVKRGNIIGFELGKYNPAIALVIDPLVKQWSTYYGGSSNESLNFCETDAASNIYTGGSTFSNTMIATSGAHQTSHGSYSGATTKADAFLVKFNSSGVRQWATYYGGSEVDLGLEIAIDGIGNIYMVGGTFSDNGMATSGSHQSTRGGNRDGFLVKFNPNGIRLWATYYGGTNLDQFEACTLDDSANIYAVGSAVSLSGISTPGAHQLSRNGGYDGLIVKFDSSGTRQWGTYYGGTGFDFVFDCSFTEPGSLYLTGTSASSSNISTTGSHQSTIGGAHDAFLVKFNASGIRQWGTYYGGPAAENFYTPSCEADTSGGVYMVGTTSSNSGISSPGSHQTSIAGSRDGFVAKFNPAGVRDWGTYFGGTGNDDIFDVSVSIRNEIYFTGGTRSITGIATAGTYQNSITSTVQDEGFFAKFSPNGTQIWGTYYGDSGNDRGHNIIKEGNDIILSGNTNSSSGISTPGSFQPNLGGLTDAFLTKFLDCNPDSVGITVVACDSFSSPSGRYSWNTSGIYMDTLPNSLGCDSVINVDLTIYSTPTITSTTQGSVCDSGSVQLFATASGGTLLWYSVSTGGSSLDTGQVFNTPIILLSTPFFVESDNSSCISTRDTIWATVNTTPQIISTTSDTTCDSGILILGASSSGGLTNWYDQTTGGSLVGTGNTFTTPLLSSTTLYWVEASDSGCISMRTAATAYIFSSSTSSIFEVSCFSYVSPDGEDTIYSSGVYSDTLNNNVGCDSIIIINLTINTVDTGVIQNGNQLIANAGPGATFQWIDCLTGNAIAGANSGTFSPATNGHYACLITQNNCTDTSSCFVVNIIGMEESPTSGIGIYPNPASNQITISGQWNETPSFTFFDSFGKEYQVTSSQEGKDFIIDTSTLSPGLFILRVIDGKNQYSRKVLIK